MINSLILNGFSVLVGELSGEEFYQLEGRKHIPFIDRLFFRKGTTDTITGVLVHGKAGVIHREGVSRRLIPSFQRHCKLVILNGVGAVLLHVGVFHGALQYDKHKY